MMSLFHDTTVQCLQQLGGTRLRLSLVLAMYYMIKHNHYDKEEEEEEEEEVEESN